MLYFFQRRNKQSLHKLSRLSQRSARRKIAVLLLQLTGVLCLHTAMICWLEGISLKDSIWLTLTTVTTVGYGDMSAETDEGRIATVILIYLLGIWMLAQLASEYIDYRSDRKDRIIKGQWNWSYMENHIVIINAPVRNSQIYLERLISQFRDTPALTDKPIVLVTAQYKDGLPRTLSDQGVVLKSADTTRGEFFDDVAAAKASHIIFIARDESESSSDSVTLDLLDQLPAAKQRRLIVAEAVLDTNVSRFQKLGANAVLRPVRAYPELLARALAAPGTEQILQDLFGYFGSSIHRYDAAVQTSEWSNIVCSLASNGLGIAMGYIDQAGEVINCPKQNEKVDAQAILIMARDNDIPCPDALKICLNSI